MTLFDVKNCSFVIHRASSGDETSTDKEEDVNPDSYDDSFIDDRSDPTAESAQVVGAPVDMMAVYRFFPNPSLYSAFGKALPT